MTQYHYACNGEQQDSPSVEGIARNMLDHPEAEHKVWTEGFAQWEDAWCIPDIADSVRKASDEDAYFHYGCDGEQRGEIRAEDIVQLILAHPASTHKVWKAGMSEWMNAIEVREIRVLVELAKGEHPESFVTASKTPPGLEITASDSEEAASPPREGAQEPQELVHNLTTQKPLPQEPEPSPSIPPAADFTEENLDEKKGFHGKKVWIIVGLSVLGVLLILGAVALLTGKKDETPLEAKPAFTVLPFQVSEIPTGLGYPGSVIDGLHWTDRLGETWVILSEEKEDGPESDYGGNSVSTLLYAHVYRANAQGGWDLVRKVQDREMACEYDVEAGFILNSATVNDEDGDLVGEAMFMYKLGCRSDFDVDPLKLILLIGGEKYALRGTTFLVYDGEELGGKPPTPDPTFSSLPDRIRSKALSHWMSFREG